METIFNVGDRVFDIRWGWGEVVEIIIGDYLIKFDTQKNPTLYNKVAIQMVSFTEYELEGFTQERPEVLPEEGQVVWVRNNSISDWEVTHFMYHEYSQYYVSSTCDEDNTKSFLYMTTKNPYADEQ